MKLIWQLLRQHVSVLQLAGFLVTNLVGVAIVLTAVQLYRDVTPALQVPDSFLDNDFIILTKEVEGAGIGKTSFTQTELAELAEQPFTEALGEFTPARYSVMGGISLAGIGMRTYLFFESVPDRFLDVRSDEWGFEEGSEFVPIILPRNYLNLYNFGFASTRGLPQVSEDLVRGITLDLDLSGRGQFRNLKGRVVAFSNRLNTILVPEEFIRWSNRRFADKPAADPSRIILEVRNAEDDAEELLDDVEDMLRTLLLCHLGQRSENAVTPYPAAWQRFSREGELSAMMRLLDAVAQARQMRANQVTWQAVVERLLLSLMEEKSKWST
mgnify:CR=1 FL=1